jgi:hypothetical protein
MEILLWFQTLLDLFVVTQNVLFFHLKQLKVFIELRPNSVHLVLDSSGDAGLSLAVSVS